MQSKWKTMENVPLSSLCVLEIESRLKTEKKKTSIQVLMQNDDEDVILHRVHLCLSLTLHSRPAQITVCIFYCFICRFFVCECDVYLGGVCVCILMIKKREEIHQFIYLTLSSQIHVSHAHALALTTILCMNHTIDNNISLMYPSIQCQTHGRKRVWEDTEEII